MSSKRLQAIAEVFPEDYRLGLNCKQRSLYNHLMMLTLEAIFWHGNPDGPPTATRVASSYLIVRKHDYVTSRHVHKSMEYHRRS